MIVIVYFYNFKCIINGTIIYTKLNLNIIQP